MNCQYCNRTLSTKYSLATHQKTAKYCLSLRNKSNDVVFECNFCKNSFTHRHTRDRHETKCKSKPLSDIIRLERIVKTLTDNEQKYGQKLKDKDQEIIDIKERHTKELIEIKHGYELKLVRLESELAQFKESCNKKDEQLFEIAKKPTTTTTNIQNNRNNTTNNYNHLSVMLDEKQTYSILYDKFTKQHLENGVAGAAQCVVENIFTDENGNNRIEYNKNDNTFYGRTEDGKIFQDPSGTKIKDIVAPPLKMKTKIILDDCDDDCVSELRDKAAEIASITNSNSKGFTKVLKNKYIKNKISSVCEIHEEEELPNHDLNRFSDCSVSMSVRNHSVDMSNEVGEDSKLNSNEVARQKAIVECNKKIEQIRRDYPGNENYDRRRELVMEVVAEKNRILDLLK